MVKKKVQKPATTKTMNNSNKHTSSKNDQVKRVYRSSDERLVGGVCGGLAKHLSLDPTWVRLFFILLTFANGIGLILYIILWIIVPLEKTSSGNIKNTTKKHKKQ